jgi:UDP-N-acetylmuramoyl-tripeptide--D-alanyl-D-alanine ligase
MAMRGLGQIAELVEIAQPSIGVVTTIGETHLEFLGSRENIARAKGELIAGLPADGVAVLNRDDEWVARLAPLSKGRVMTYGLDGVADVTASQVRFEPSGMVFRLSASGTHADVRLLAWGRHNVSNALAAATVGVALGMDVATISAGCAAWKPPKMRLEPVRVGDVVILNDAYNSSPTSARAAFDVLEDVARGGRMLAVLGAMKELGPQSADMHRAVGRDVARRHIAVLLTVGEGAEAIGEGAIAGGMDRRRVEHVETVEQAVGKLRTMLQPKDVVLIKGSRAAEMERIVDTLRTAGRTAS